MSDKAKALLKLATKSLKVDRIPDLFHIMNDVSSVMKYAFHQLTTSTNKETKAIKALIDKGIDAIDNKNRLLDQQNKLHVIAMGKATYQHHLRRLSTSLHPFSILSSAPHNAAVVEEKLQYSLNKIKVAKAMFDIVDTKNKLGRVQRQIPDAAKQIDHWWGWVHIPIKNDFSVLKL